MKKILVSMYLLLLAIVLVSCSSEPTLVGKWHLHSISDEELSEEEKAATIEFNENGTFVQVRGEHEKKGTWAPNEDGTLVTIIPDGDEAQEMKDMKYEGETVSFKDGEELITLERVKKD